VKVGGVISQQTAAEQLLLLPQAEQADLRFLQRVTFFALRRSFFLRQELLEAVQKAWGRSAPARSPEGERMVC